MESLWQIRSLFLQRLRRAGRDSWQLRQSHPAGEGGWQSAHPLARAMVEILFWSVTTLIISMFLYYCAWGKLSVHAGLGFFTGLLLWKKMCCAIIKTWEKTDEAKNLKITARSSTWRKPAPGGSKKTCRERKKGRKGAARQTAEHQRQASHPQKQDPEKNNNGDHDRDHRPFSVPARFQYHFAEKRAI